MFKFRYLIVIAIVGLSVFPVSTTFANAASVFHSCDAHGQKELGPFIVQNNAWSGDHGPQCITASSYHRWHVVSTQPGTTSVKTYPSVTSGYYRDGEIPYRSLTALRSVYNESMPARNRNYIAEAAYDIWLNNWNIEVMAWTDNHGQVPAGNPVHTYRVYGIKWTLWIGDCGQPCYSFVRHVNKPHGMVHILSLLRILVARGNIRSSATVTDVQSGWEICSTSGRPLTFTIHNYSLYTERR